MIRLIFFQQKEDSASYENRSELQESHRRKENFGQYSYLEKEESYAE